MLHTDPSTRHTSASFRTSSSETHNALIPCWFSSRTSVSARAASRVCRNTVGFFVLIAVLRRVLLCANLCKQWQATLDTWVKDGPYTNRWRSKEDVSLLLGTPPSSCDPLPSDGPTIGVWCKKDGTLDLVLPGSLFRLNLLRDRREHRCDCSRYPHSYPHENTGAGSAIAVAFVYGGERRR